MSVTIDSMYLASDLSTSDSASGVDALLHAQHETLVRQRSGPGILVMIEPLHLVHMNSRARDLLTALRGSAFRKGLPNFARGILPPILIETCNQIFHHLRERTEIKDWEHFEITSLVCHNGHGILVRGFGLPDSGPKRTSRVVLLLDRVEQRKGRFDQMIQGEFNFTAREQTVIQSLAKGWTNKEIANALNITLPTVKEHIRHIMEKTKCSTRTGILIRVFQGPSC